MPAAQRVKLKGKKKDKYLDLARELKKLWNMKVTVILIVVGNTWSDPQRIDTRTGGLGNKRTSRDHPKDSITKIGLNTEKSPRDFRRLAVS